MLVIPVNRVVDMKRIIGKNGGPRGGTRGVADPKKVSWRWKPCGSAGERCRFARRYIHWRTKNTNFGLFERP
jgi:hypothetical protein